MIQFNLTIFTQVIPHLLNLNSCFNSNVFESNQNVFPLIFIKILQLEARISGQLYHAVEIVNPKSRRVKIKI